MTKRTKDEKVADAPAPEPVTAELPTVGGSYVDGKLVERTKPREKQPAPPAGGE